MQVTMSTNKTNFGDRMADTLRGKFKISLGGNKTATVHDVRAEAE